MKILYITPVFCIENETVMFGFGLKSSLNCGYGHIEETNETRIWHIFLYMSKIISNAGHFKALFPYPSSIFINPHAGFRFFEENKKREMKKMLEFAQVINGLFYQKWRKNVENAQLQPIAQTKSEFAFNLVKMRKKASEKYRNCTLTSGLSIAILQLQNNRLRNVVKQKQS